MNLPKLKNKAQEKRNSLGIEIHIPLSHLETDKTPLEHCLASF